MLIIQIFIDLDNKLGKKNAKIFCEYNLVNTGKVMETHGTYIRW